MQHEMLTATHESYFKIDPRTKLILMFFVNMFAFRGGNIFIMLTIAAIPVVLLFAERKIKGAIICAAVYLAAALINEWIVPATHGAANVLVVMISGMVYRLMPGFIMGYYLVVTTTVSEFIAAMERMHISQKILIPLSVMFRFFPTVVQEARSIGDAMRMRGIAVGGSKFWKRPMSMIEYRIVPLMMSTVKIGEELSAASLTRGLGGPQRRTNICKIGFSIHDLVLLSIVTVVLLAYVLFEKGGVSL